MDRTPALLPKSHHDRRSTVDECVLIWRLIREEVAVVDLSGTIE